MTSHIISKLIGITTIFCILWSCSKDNPITTVQDSHIVPKLASVHAAPGMDTIYPSIMYGDSSAQLMSLLSKAKNPKVILWWNESGNFLNRHRLFNNLAGVRIYDSIYNQKFHDSIWAIVNDSIPLHRRTVSFTEVESKFPLILRADLFEMPSEWALSSVPNFPNSKFGEAKVLIIDDVDNNGSFDVDRFDSIGLRLQGALVNDTIGYSDILSILEQNNWNTNVLNPEQSSRYNAFQFKRSFRQDSLINAFGRSICYPRGTEDYLIGFSGYHSILYATDSIAAVYLEAKPSRFFSVDTLVPGYNIIFAKQFPDSMLRLISGKETGRQAIQWTNLGTENSVLILRAFRWDLGLWWLFNNAYFPTYLDAKIFGMRKIKIAHNEEFLIPPIKKRK